MAPTGISNSIFYVNTSKGRRRCKVQRCRQKGRTLYWRALVQEEEGWRIIGVGASRWVAEKNGAASIAMQDER